MASALPYSPKSTRRVGTSELSESVKAGYRFVRMAGDCPIASIHRDAAKTFSRKLGLISGARSDALKCYGEEIIVVNPFCYESLPGEVLRYL